MEAKKITVVPHPGQITRISTRNVDLEEEDEQINTEDTYVEILEQVAEDHYHINNGGVGVKVMRDQDNCPVVEMSLSNMGHQSKITFYPHPIVLKQISDLFLEASKQEFNVSSVFAAHYSDRHDLMKERDGIVEDHEMKVKGEDDLAEINKDVVKVLNQKDVRDAWADMQAEDKAKLAKFDVSVE